MTTEPTRTCETRVWADNMFASPSWKKWAGGGHLFATSRDELLAFAQRIGLRRNWIQDGTLYGKPFAHFDLTASKRRAALDAGAINCEGVQAIDAAMREALGVPPRPSDSKLAAKFDEIAAEQTERGLTR